MKELFLVDGYNLLGRRREIFGSRDLESARQWLMEQLSAYAHLKGCRVVVVFDGAGRGDSRKEGAPGVEVIYSEERGGADQIIERLAATEAPVRPVTVVTADYLEQKVAFRSGVARKTPRELLEELGELKEEQGAKLSSRQKRYPLEERLKLNVRQELDQLLRDSLKSRKPDSKS